ncbi:ABC transporter ATP-binding protein [Clostridium paraputrificum]|uniref:ABC transporter ATP-binding protein n=1 Tax=Clostridium TaxID=1485 RepID=UPI003D34078A
MIEVLGVKRYFGANENIVKAIDDISLNIDGGEFIAIVGSSGSGKSTLLHILAGLDKPTEGKVLIDNINIYNLTDDELTIFRRRKIGLIFQSYNLIPIINVYDNIVLPLELDGAKIDREYIDDIIKVLGLEDRMNFLPSKLSGGQQQRVAIARALAIKPSIILADEPTGNLDTKKEQEVIGLLRLMSQRFNQTIVMITHNEEIAQLAHRIIHIEDGKIINRCD